MPVSRFISSRNLFRFNMPLRCFVGAGSIFLAVSAYGQTAAERVEAGRQSELIQRENQDRLQRDLDASRGTRVAPSGAESKQFLPTLEVPLIAATCSNTKTISIEGAPHLSRSVREQLMSEFAGRCVGVKEIEQILGAITQDYVQRGFITTRAYLPSQELSTGELRIEVLEGRIERIVIDDDGARSIRSGTAFPAEAGDLLNLRDLEQGIDQVNRMSSNRAELDIEPGERAGQSAVVVRNRPTRPLHLSFTVDDQGNEATGRNQAGLTLIADGILGLNEVTALTHRQSVPNDREHRSALSDSFSIAVPFGYTTFSAATSRSSYASMFSAPSGLRLRSNGTSSSDNVKLDRVVYRDPSSRVSLSGAFTSKTNANYLGGEYLAVSSRSLGVMDLAVAASTAMLGGVIAADLGHSQGLNHGGAQKDFPDLPTSAPHFQFKKVTYGLSYYRPVRVGVADLTLSSQLTGQRTSVGLFGSEQIAIGGAYSVRGFSRHSLVGDKGYFVRNELSSRHALDIGGQAVAVRLYGALDNGRVTSIAQGNLTGRLTGMAVGATLSWSALALDVSVAAPIWFPTFFTREPPQTSVRLTFSI